MIQFEQVYILWYILNNHLLYHYQNECCGLFGYAWVTDASIESLMAGSRAFDR